MKRRKPVKQWSRIISIESEPTQAYAQAAARQFRAALPGRRLTALPFVSEEVSPYQWRIRGVRVIGYYDIGGIREQGWRLRTDALERVA